MQKATDGIGDPGGGLQVLRSAAQVWRISAMPYSKLLKLHFLRSNFGQHGYSVLDAQALNFSIFQIAAEADELPPLCGQHMLPIRVRRRRKCREVLVIAHCASLSVYRRLRNLLCSADQRNICHKLCFANTVDKRLDGAESAGLAAGGGVYRPFAPTRGSRAWASIYRTLVT